VAEYCSAVHTAEVNFSGYARFGMQYTSIDATDTTSTDVVSRFRLQADVSTTTDAGIGLNARQRFQTEENLTGNGGNGVRFGMTYEGLAINFGNINGVIESAPNLYLSTNSAGIGLEGQSWSNLAVNNAGGRFGWTAYDSAGAGANNGVEVIYSMNGMGVHVHSTEDSTGFGANYKISNITLAAAREEFDAGGEITFASAGVALGNGKVAVSYGDTNGVTKSVLAAQYDMAPGANLQAFIGSEDAGESYGVGVNYALGGGASFDAGVDSNAGGDTRVSAGIFFKF
jgi:outer membrane protein OmpU